MSYYSYPDPITTPTAAVGGGSILYTPIAAPAAVGGSGINMATIIPSNLEQLEKDDVVNLLKRVASERDHFSAELDRQLKKPCLNTSYSTQPAWSAPPPASLWSAPPPPMISPVSPPFDVIGTKKRILKNATAQIKKTEHKNNNKPYTSLVDNVQSQPSILALMNGFEPKTNSNAIMRWILDEEAVLDWLNMRDKPTIHPVKNKLYCYVVAGENPPPFHVHAGIESVDVKWSRKSGTLDLKFRTLIVGTGKTEIRYW